jgi:hypothetical protein
MHTLPSKLKRPRIPEWADRFRGYAGLLAAGLLGWFSGPFIEAGGYAAGNVYLLCVVAVPVAVCCLAGRWYFFTAFVSLLFMQASLVHVQWGDLFDHSKQPRANFLTVLDRVPFMVGILLLVSWAVAAFFRRTR